MSPPLQTTPVAYAAAACEAAFSVAGIALMAWLMLAKAGRDRMVVRLQAWPVSGIDFACFICCGFVGCAAASSLGGFITHRAHLGSDASAVLGALCVDGGFLAGLAGFQAMVATRGGAGRARIDRPLALKTGFATFLAATPLVFAVSWAWQYALGKAGYPVENQTVVDAFESMHSVPLQWCFVALAATIVPAAEELVFRAGLFRFFRTRMPGWAANLATSVLFGAAHVDWSNHMAGLAALVPLVALSSVYCLAYERTGSIGTTIVAHSLFNLNMTLLILAGIGS